MEIYKSKNSFVNPSLHAFVLQAQESNGLVHVLLAVAPSNVKLADIHLSENKRKILVFEAKTKTGF